MNKYELATKLYQEYRNSFGGMRQYSYFDTGNPHLYNGYTALVLKELDLYNEAWSQEFNEFMLSTRVESGLHGRFPTRHYIYQNKIDVVSHDEMTGMAILSSLDNNFQASFGNQIIEYGIKNEFVYMEQFPNVIRNFKKIGKVIKYFYQILRGKIDKDELDQTADPEVMAFRYRRKAKDRAILKISNNVKPSLIEKISLYLHILRSSIEFDLDYANGTSILLTWARLEILKNKNYSTCVTNLLHRYFWKRMRKKLGRYSLHKVVSLHFPERGHPLPLLAKLMDDKRNNAD